MRQKSGLDSRTILGKWDIISSLAEKPKAPTEIAKEIQKSLSNVTQQLKLLEAFGLVKIEKIENSGLPGKPKTVYALTNELFIIATPEKQKILKTQPISSLLANVLLLDDADDAYFLIKAIFKEDFFTKIQGISIVKNGKDAIELFILTEHLEEIRKKYSNMEIHLQEKTKKVICWSHNTFEVEAGLNNKESHFITLFANQHILYDPERHISRLQRLRP
jgi:hypothetical protein